MRTPAYRFAAIAWAVLACQGYDESSMADSSALPRTDSIAAAPPPPVSTAEQDTVPRKNPSLDPADTIPVRLAPPTSQSIIDTATLPTIQKIVARHPQRVDSTIRVMTEQWQRANRTPSAGWTALQDSVKQDIERLASLGDGELVTFFRQHYARFVRLGDVHRTAMGGPPIT